MNRFIEPRKTLTLTSLRSERQRTTANVGLSVAPIQPEIEMRLNEIGEWVNEGGAGGEVKRL